MPTKDTRPRAEKERRDRLNPETYRTAKKVETLMASEHVAPATKQMLAEKVIAYTDAVGVTLAHPAIVQAAILATARVAGSEGGYSEDASRKRLDLNSWTRAAWGVYFTRDGEPKSPEATPDNPDEEQAEDPRAPVDLNLWRQSRPRPVSSLLFAEKGGRDDA